MPKINSASVVTDVNDPNKTVPEQIAEAHGVEVDELSTELDENNNPVERKDEDKEVETSPGNNSSTSTETREKTQNKNDDKNPSPVLTTENPSKKDQTADFSVDTTGGSKSSKSTR